MIEDPQGAAIDLLQNGSFDSDVVGNPPQAWRMVGNHDGSLVVQDPDDPQNNVLRLTATGPTEHMSNHGETTLANRAEIDEDKEYMISFRAKWISGSPQVNTRLYFNRAAETTVIETVTPNGTPGAPNSLWQENVGPTFGNLRHEPIVPTSDDTITVSVDANDPDGVASLELHYSVDGRASVSLVMTETTPGTFTAEIPSQSNGRAIQFYVSGLDSRGERSQYPRLGPESHAIVRVTDRELPGDGPSIRIWMTPSDVTRLHNNSNVMSNDRLGATIVLDNSTIVYDAGVRLRASGYGRQGQLAGFNIEFPPDQLFRGVHETIALDRGTVLTDGGAVRGTPGASPHELLIYQIANHAGGIAAMYDDVIQVDAPRRANSGMALLKMARYTDTFLDSQFEDGSDGSLFKYELIYHATTTVNGNPEGLKRGPNAVVGTDIKDLGTDEEAYRLNFILKNNRDRDDLSAIVNLGRAFSQSRAELDAASRAVMDVDQWMRTFALLSLVGVADVYNMGLAHNLELYVRPTDGKVLAFPWDVDHGFFYGVQSSILGRGGSNLHRIVNLPQNRRLFYKHLQDIVASTYNLDYLEAWARHYTEITGFDFADFFTDYVDRRSAFVLSELNRVAPQIPFEIDKEVQPIVVDGLSATLTGQGWIDVHQIRLANQDQPLEVTWTDSSHWQVEIPLEPGENTMQLQAFNFQGESVGTDSILATSTVVDRPLREFLRVSELMYNPSDPTPSELRVNPNWRTTTLSSWNWSIRLKRYRSTCRSFVSPKDRRRFLNSAMLRFAISILVNRCCWLGTWRRSRHDMGQIILLWGSMRAICVIAVREFGWRTRPKA